MPEVNSSQIPDVRLPSTLRYPANFANHTPVDLVAIARSNGFEIFSLKETATNHSVLHLRHSRTGMTVISIHAADDHCYFDLSIPTPPVDSSGLSHIIEHSVISGSTRFPSANALDEMRTALMLTGVNATTYPDYTSYYASGVIHQNLLAAGSMYIDAAFRPLLTRGVFARECGQFVSTNSGQESGVAFDGIVFNEMLGKIYSPQTMRYLARNAFLMPGTPFAFQSGGDPAEMVGLTYERFVEQYKTWYQTHKAVVTIYGNISLEERLSFLGGELSSLSPSQIMATVPPQLPAPQMRTAVARFCARHDQDLSRQHMTEIHWHTRNDFSIQDQFNLSIISRVLSSAEHSPFSLALRAAGISGTTTGLETFIYGGTKRFSVAAIGHLIHEESAVRDLLGATIQKICKEGFEPELLAAAISKLQRDVQLELLDARYGTYISNNLRFLALNGDYSVDEESFDERLAKLKGSIARGERPLETLLRRCTIDNPDRYDMTHLPDPALVAAMKMRVDEAVKVAAARFLAGPAGTSSLEALSLPSAPVKPAKMPLAVIREEHLRVIRPPVTSYQHYSAKIFHAALKIPDPIIAMELSIPVSGMNAYRQAVLFSALTLMLDCGPEGYRNGEYSKRLSKLSTVPGIDFEHVYDLPTFRHDAPLQKFLTIGFTCSAAALPELLDLIAQSINEPYFGRPLELKNHLDSVVLNCLNKLGDPNALFGMLKNRLRAACSSLGAANYIHSRNSDLNVHRKLQEQSDRDFGAIADQCMEEFKAAFSSGGAEISASCNSVVWEQVRGDIERFVDRLPGTGSVPPMEIFHPLAPNIFRPIDSRSGFTGYAVPMNSSSIASGALHLVMAELLEQVAITPIRVEGKAYGCSVTIDQEHGAVLFGSYRDPKCTRSLGVFRTLPSILRTSVTEDLLARAKLQIVASNLYPVSPLSRGLRAILSARRGYSVEMSNRAMATAVATTLKDVFTFADKLEAALASPKCHSVVYGDEATFAEAQREGYQLNRATHDA